MAGTANASPIIAARYASALFDIADERHTLDQIEGDLQTLKRLLADNADLRGALRNPADAAKAATPAAGIMDQPKR